MELPQHLLDKLDKYLESLDCSEPSWFVCAVAAVFWAGVLWVLLVCVLGY